MVMLALSFFGLVAPVSVILQAGRFVAASVIAVRTLTSTLLLVAGLKVVPAPRKWARTSSFVRGVIEVRKRPLRSVIAVFTWTHLPKPTPSTTDRIWIRIVAPLTGQEFFRSSPYVDTDRPNVTVRGETFSESNEELVG